MAQLGFLRGLAQGATPTSTSTTKSGGKNYPMELELLRAKNRMQQRNWRERRGIVDRSEDQKWKRQKAFQKYTQEQSEAKEDSNFGAISFSSIKKLGVKEYGPGWADKVRPTYDIIMQVYNPGSTGSRGRREFANLGYLPKVAKVGPSDKGFGSAGDRGFYQEDNTRGVVLIPGEKYGGFQGPGFKRTWIDAKNKMMGDKNIYDAISKAVGNKQPVKHLGIVDIVDGSPVFYEGEDDAVLREIAGRSEHAYNRYINYQLNAKLPGKTAILEAYIQHSKDKEKAVELNVPQANSETIVARAENKIKKREKVRKTQEKKETFTAPWADPTKNKKWKLFKKQDYRVGDKTQRVVFGSAEAGIKPVSTASWEEVEGIIKVGDRDEVIKMILAEGRGTTPSIRRSMLGTVLNRLYLNTWDTAGASASKLSLSGTINQTPQAFASSNSKDKGGMEQYAEATKIFNSPSDTQRKMIAEIDASIEYAIKSPEEFMGPSGIQRELGADIGGSTHFYTTGLEAGEAQVASAKDGFITPSAAADTSFDAIVARNKTGKTSVQMLLDVVKKKTTTIVPGEYSVATWERLIKETGWLSEHKSLKDVTEPKERAEIARKIHNNRVEAQQIRKDTVQSAIRTDKKVGAAGHVQITIDEQSNFDGQKLPTVRSEKKRTADLSAELDRLWGKTAMKPNVSQRAWHTLKDINNMLANLSLIEARTGQEGRLDWATRAKRRYLNPTKVAELVTLAKHIKDFTHLGPNTMMYIDNVETAFPELVKNSHPLKMALTNAVDQRKSELQQLAKQGNVIIERAVDSKDNEVVLIHEVKPATNEDIEQYGFRVTKPYVYKDLGKKKTERLATLTGGKVDDIFLGNSQLVVPALATIANLEKRKEVEKTIKQVSKLKRGVVSFNSGQPDDRGITHSAQDIVDEMFKEGRFSKDLHSMDSILGISNALFHTELQQSSKVVTDSDSGVRHVTLHPNYTIDNASTKTGRQSGLNDAIKEAEQVSNSAGIAQSILESIEDVTIELGARRITIESMGQRYRSVIEKAFMEMANDEDGIKQLTSVIQDLAKTGDADTRKYAEEVLEAWSQEGLLRSSPQATVLDKIWAKIRGFKSGVSGFITSSSNSMLQNMKKQFFDVKSPTEHITNRDARGADLERFKEEANDRLTKLMSSNATDEQKYQGMLAAQRTFYAIALTYHFAGMVQGGSGGRAISNEDFEHLFEALWGGGGDLSKGSIISAKLLVNDAINRATIVKAVQHRGIHMINHVLGKVRTVQRLIRRKLLGKENTKLRNMLLHSKDIDPVTAGRHTDRLLFWTTKNSQNGVVNSLGVSQLKNFREKMKEAIGSTVLRNIDPKFRNTNSGKIEFGSVKDIPQKYLQSYSNLLEKANENMPDANESQIPLNDFKTAILTAFIDTLDREPTGSITYVPLGGRNTAARPVRDIFSEFVNNIDAGERQKNENMHKPMVHRFIQDIMNDILLSSVGRTADTSL